MTERDQMAVYILASKDISKELGLNFIVLNFKDADKVVEMLKEQPEQKFFVDFDGKITPLPKQKHGYWVPIKSPTGVEYGGVEEYTVQEVMCSGCGFTDDVSASIYTYCPECGAKMGGEVEQDG